MTAAAVQDRNSKAGEYLQLLRSLASEMEKAMQAIARNALLDLEESVDRQQAMSERLVVLANEISPPLASSAATSLGNRSRDNRPGVDLDEEMRQQVLVAGDALQKLNRRYAVLLQHSTRSVAQMASLFSSFKGQFKEASGPRLKHQTWSCEV